MQDLMEQVKVAVIDGESLDEVDERLIAPAPIDDDHKAALWLYGWFFMDRAAQRVLVMDHLSRLDDVVIG